MLAHELPGTRDLDVVLTGVRNKDRVVQLLIRDGLLQVAASSTKHVPTVPVKEQKPPVKGELGTSQQNLLKYKGSSPGVQYQPYSWLVDMFLKVHTEVSSAS